MQASASKSIYNAGRFAYYNPQKQGQQTQLFLQNAIFFVKRAVSVLSILTQPHHFASFSHLSTSDPIIVQELKDALAVARKDSLSPWNSDQHNIVSLYGTNGWGSLEVSFNCKTFPVMLSKHSSKN